MKVKGPGHEHVEHLKTKSSNPFKPRRPESNNKGPRRMQNNKNRSALKKKNGKEKLKKNEEYSHLLDSAKLTVFDWDSTIVLRNLPPQLEIVKKSVRKELGNISVEINKFAVIKNTFKNTALVSLACVLTNQLDVVKAVGKLHGLEVCNHRLIVSRFLKPHSFVPNAFSVCVQNFPLDASENELAEVLSDCGSLQALEVEYSEVGAVKKVVANLVDSSSVATLLEKNGTLLKKCALNVVRLDRSNSVIAGNVHPKTSKAKLNAMFEGNLLIQKLHNQMFQIFFKDEEAARNALSRDGDTVKGMVLSVSLWTEKKNKQYKVFVNLVDHGVEKNDGLKFDLHKCMQQCGKVCSVSPIKKKVTFLVIFESKEGQKAALQLNGQVINGKTLEITKKRSRERTSLGGSSAISSIGHPVNKINLNADDQKKHVYFGD